MKTIIQKHKYHWTQKTFFTSAILGCLLLLASLVINYNAGMYATRNAGPAVNDIFLDNFPVVNVDFIFMEGAFIFILLLMTLLLIHPKFIPFILKSTSIFLIIRSIFISLTHIGPSPDQLPIITNSIDKFFIFSGDLFFSGHTGLPFLMALIFWNYKGLRRIFMILSIIAGISVLLGHLHYSIDVFAAFFITYGIFRMSQIFFKKDYNYAMLE